MSGYPSGYSTPPKSSAMHNPLAGQFPTSNVQNMQGVMQAGLQFNLGQTGGSPNQSGTNPTQVNPAVSAQGANVAPNTVVQDAKGSLETAGMNVSTRVTQGGTPTDTAQVAQAPRDINTASLCRIGQETVQDIVSRTQEIFQTLKTIQPPNGTVPGSNTSNDKKLKIQEQLRTIRILFKRLRLIYEKCNENTQLQGMEYTHIESLIPLKDEYDMKIEERKNSEAYRQASEECKELMDQVAMKNKHLKEIVDHLRRMIWEINTMLAMRRS